MSEIKEYHNVKSLIINFMVIIYMINDYSFQKEIIAFFGASVTAQKNSYSKKLTKLFNKKEHIFGYGGCHLKNAGIVFIDKVLKIKPTICFIEWFSTEYTIFDENTINYLNTIVYKFSKNNCKLVFLLLTRADHDINIDWYNKLKKYFKDNNLIYIDVNDKTKYSKLLIRDAVHTTDYGSVYYSNYIFKMFNSLYNKLKIPQNLQKTKYTSLKKLNINKKVNKYIKLKGNCIIFTCYIIVGPNSGYIEVNGNEILLWDQYCHYNRKNCKISNIKIDGHLELKILQKKVDYSSCRRNFDFSNVMFELNILEIYYIGDNLNFVEGL